jgi:hypothetical protein
MRCLTFQIKPGRKDEALRLMEASIAESRLAGLMAWYLVDVPGEDRAMSFALWESSAAMTHADVVAHNERNLAGGSDVLVGPPTMAVYEVVAHRHLG